VNRFGIIDIFRILNSKTIILKEVNMIDESMRQTLYEAQEMFRTHGEMRPILFMIILVPLVSPLNKKNIFKSMLMNLRMLY
jgi:hypothetical protein